MKKLAIITAIGMAIASGSAMAAQTGEVQFFGNVTAATCNIIPEIDGAVNNLLQLGTVSNGGTGAGNDIGDEIPFALKAAPNDAGCKALGSTKSALVSWDGPLNAVGVQNVGGLATDAVVLLATVNAKTTPVTSVTSGKNTVEFIENLVNTDGYKFTAQLKGGTTVGDFKSAAAYAVTYQ